jgi:predicted DNA-binding transcriptional regulator YafY
MATAAVGPERRFRAAIVIPKVERQHRLIEELRAVTPRSLSGDRLAESLGTSVRTVERDIGSLQDAGVPIGVRRGPGGGYSIDARLTVPDPRLTPGEVAAIIASLAAVGPYSSASARSALDKLIDALVVERPGNPRPSGSVEAS